jgi:hypothetical protein
MENVESCMNEERRRTNKSANDESARAPDSSFGVDSSFSIPPSSPFSLHHSTLVIAGIYAAVTVGMTWPLAVGITRDVPADLGDPLLNMWILDWMAMGIVRMASGSMSFADIWNANIFHPEPLALGFSEHLFGQALQMLPVYLASGNLILGYNVIFLSTYVLAALGMYLLALDLTGRRDAAFVAGLMFAFTPLRVTQLSHIQILSTQWMPFTLYGFRRYIVDRRWSALVGGSASLLMLAWSCGYYLVYFSPLVPLFVVHQMHAHRRLRDWRMWLALTGAAAVVALGTLPFLLMYAEARRVHGFERPLSELVRFSADLGGYLTASAMVRVWGPVLRLTPKPEGEVFLGFTVLTLMVVGVVGLARGARRAASNVTRASGWRRLAIAAVGLISSVQFLGLVIVLATGGYVASVAGMAIRATNIGRIFLSLAVGVAALVVLSPRVRCMAVAFAQSWMTWAAAMGVLAMWLSLGPQPSTLGRPIEGAALYRALFDHVPGFDGLRVPARYAMVAVFFLIMLAAAGSATSMRRAARPALVAAFLSLFVLVEGCAVPMPVNATWGDGPVVPPPRVYAARDAPAVYRALASFPPSRVVAEFPFGDPAWELRYVYYATVHRQRLVNGYSGGFPRGYHTRVAALQRFVENPTRAWQTLVDAGVTHVVLHRAATTPEDAEATAAWLTSRGAALMSTLDRQDELYAMPLR